MHLVQLHIFLPNGIHSFTHVGFLRKEQSQPRTLSISHIPKIDSWEFYIQISCIEIEHIIIFLNNDHGTWGSFKSSVHVGNTTHCLFPLSSRVTIKVHASQANSKFSSPLLTILCMVLRNLVHPIYLAWMWFYPSQNDWVIVPLKQCEQTLGNRKEGQLLKQTLGMLS